MSCDNTWLTRDGRVLWLHDMTDRHLRNSIEYVSRSLSGAWAFSMSLRGEMALVAIDAEISTLEGIQEALLVERSRRQAVYEAIQETVEMPE